MTVPPLIIAGLPSRATNQVGDGRGYGTSPGTQETRPPMSLIEPTRPPLRRTDVRTPSAAEQLAARWSFTADLESAPDLSRCLVRGCGDNHHCLGLCLRHYQKHQYWADPERARAKRRARYARQKARREAEGQAA